MVAHTSSVWVIAHSIPSHLLPHGSNWQPCQLSKRSAAVAPDVDLRECTLSLPTQKVNRAVPTVILNPEETSQKFKTGVPVAPK